jgi:ubiquinone/menaquinone biosynthesis C-methylase UbiE
VSSGPEYVLGSAAAEVQRLDAQAATIAAATVLLLRAAGLEPGMRVLDLGCGLGHVTFAAAEIVGRGGSVVGIDQSEVLLEIAESRRREAGLRQVAFAQADVRDFAPAERVDAVVARLLLFHLPDRVPVLEHHRQASLRPGGRFVALDFDAGTARSEPSVASVQRVAGWIESAFHAAHADPRVGARLGVDLATAGFADVETFGLQGYYPPGDPRGPAMLAGLVGSLAQPIVAAGIASAAELDEPSLEARLAADLEAVDAVFLPPGLVVAWGRAYGQG